MSGKVKLKIENLSKQSCVFIFLFGCTGKLMVTKANDFCTHHSATRC